MGRWDGYVAFDRLERRAATWAAKICGENSFYKLKLKRQAFLSLALMQYVLCLSSDKYQAGKQGNLIERCVFQDLICQSQGKPTKGNNGSPLIYTTSFVKIFQYK
jgi:hypothetical protein